MSLAGYWTTHGSSPSCDTAIRGQREQAGTNFDVVSLQLGGFMWADLMLLTQNILPAIL